MRLLFLHQNCPGQYKRLAPLMARTAGSQVVFITQPGKPDLPGVTKVEYKLARKPSKETHRYLRGFEDAVLHGQAVARAAISLRERGFRPDVICAHPSWGEALYVKDVFPRAKLIMFCEFYYRAEGSDVGFDPPRSPTVDDRCRVRTKNATHLLTLEQSNAGVAPTRWQRDQFPPEFLPRISVIHDGIDTAGVAPDPTATLELPDGRVLRASDEVVTYVARNLEPYRGFHIFMRALEESCRRRPNAHYIIVGGDGVSYGSALPDGQTYRAKLLSEVKIDERRVHFLGRLPYDRFLRVLQVSGAHVYLTYPFVLSWSMLEAMSAGCVVIGSATPPVEEVIEDGRNGLLVDFFSAEQIADRIDEVLAHKDRLADLRRQARKTVIERYELARCLQRHARLIRQVAAGARVPASAAPAAARAPQR